MGDLIPSYFARYCSFLRFLGLGFAMASVCDSVEKSDPPLQLLPPEKKTKHDDDDEVHVEFSDVESGEKKISSSDEESGEKKISSSGEESGEKKISSSCEESGEKKMSSSDEEFLSSEELIKSAIERLYVYDPSIYGSSEDEDDGGIFATDLTTGEKFYIGGEIDIEEFNILFKDIPQIIISKCNSQHNVQLELVKILDAYNAFTSGFTCGYLFFINFEAKDAAADDGHEVNTYQAQLFDEIPLGTCFELLHFYKVPKDLSSPNFPLIVYPTKYTPKVD